MSFEIRPTETFLAHFRELPIPAQEGILDLLDDMRLHPGEFIDRSPAISIRAMRTRAARINTGKQFVWFTIIFQYDADEESIHIYDLITETEDHET